MYAVLALLLAGLASVQGYTCGICGVIPGKEYCCSDLSDSHYCCSFEEYYYKFGFVDTKTLYILIAVGAGVLLTLIFLICCCCCSCCPCYRRRQQGAVYNSVVLPCAPAYQPSSNQYYPAQYPPQPSSNPHLAASAPYPTLPKV
ncbi:Protein shisa-4 [Frankliniella fusca]|uniref:Protein shisa-4 n=1 Tax=Frankliniella fusca TaxID=407009 RepID=A0AAE1GPH3_9NEOP|nr:Protein shisa-4 [Frankliniella fusca]